MQGATATSKNDFKPEPLRELYKPFEFLYQIPEFNALVDGFMVYFWIMSSNSLGVPGEVNKPFYRKFLNLWHLLFWILYSTDELLSLLGLTESIYFIDYLVQLLPFIGIAYFNLYILKPFLLDKRKLGLYALAVSTTVLIFPLLHHTVLNLVMGVEDCIDCGIPPISMTSDFLSFYIFVCLEIMFVLGTTTAIQLFQDLSRARGRIQNLENKKLQTELDLLKAQINPHFLFNSLNNIYVLTRTNPPQASEIILQLSDLLSYQLYDCAKEKVLLEKEIEYLQNFLDVHRIRRDKAHISFNFKGNSKGISIPPLLFIPFVENAVKHGNSVSENGYIKVEMTVSDSGEGMEDSSRNSSGSGVTLNDETKPGKLSGRILTFRIANTKGDPLPQTTKGGLGLENVKRRLELLYPSRHRLEIQNEDNIFSVDLEIEL